VLTRKWHARFPEISEPVRQESDQPCLAPTMTSRQSVAEGKRAIDGLSHGQCAAGV